VNEIITPQSVPLLDEYLAADETLSTEILVRIIDERLDPLIRSAVRRRLHVSLDLSDERRENEEARDLVSEARLLIIEKLQKLEEANPDLITPDSPTQRVGGRPAEGFPEVVHTRQMLSLDNTYNIDELRAFTGYQLLFARDEGELATVYLPDVPGPLALGFLAGDRVEEFLTGIGPDGRDAAHLVELDGVAVFELLRDERVAGVVLNAGSERQYVLFRMDIMAISEAERVG